jgi:hypothetical protein
MNSRFCFALLFVPALPVLGLFAACSSTSNSTAGVVVPEGGTADGPAADAPTGGGTQCTKARDDLLLPIDKTSTGKVSIISESGATKTLYVDASAGGLDQAAKNPRIYVALATGTKVDLTDKTAPDSTEWDLALKRDVIFTNGGDTGAGVGGAIQIAKSFSSVTDAEANAAEVEKERLFDEECNPQLDSTGAASTTFASPPWYDYDQVTHIPSPRDVTYVVVGATGARYKVGIKAYSGLPDGGTGPAGANYVIQVTAL